MSSPEQAPASRPVRERRVGTFTFGAALVICGVLMLVGLFFPRLDLTLEEYLGEVRKYPAGGAPFRFSTAEWECALTYLPGGVGEPFRLAGQQGLLCSGDNCGGVVAASWRSTGR